MISLIFALPKHGPCLCEGSFRSMRMFFFSVSPSGTKVHAFAVGVIDLVMVTFFFAICFCVLR